ncbi:ribonuclease P protein component [Salinimicrobium sp. CDJ15-81-2]|uniref:Ribonuclease P protein component n=1 Tax=Salinimicrobium oceani TaxID=2722702 RepID=A0ABX1D5M1_9FLAO|nr:ribonuclease P protein component [Salinimicrobium oceani]NJW54478.1 ribonuclease P protein component [Salinimicrobium oceani]NJY61461.1 ribonuclease P protein component [Salinimicrobium nanhaiense]
MDESFGKKEKLKSKIIIDRLFTEGNSLKKYPLRLIFLPLVNTSEAVNKAAVSVPKRNFKRAVDRIKIKRLMREAYRKNKYLVTSNLDISYALMFIYTGREINDYTKILRATEELLKNFVEQEKSRNHEKESL